MRAAKQGRQRDGRRSCVAKSLKPRCRSLATPRQRGRCTHATSACGSCFCAARRSASNRMASHPPCGNSENKERAQWLTGFAPLRSAGRAHPSQCARRGSPVPRDMLRMCRHSDDGASGASHSGERRSPIAGRRLDGDLAPGSGNHPSAARSPRCLWIRGVVGRQVSPRARAHSADKMTHCRTHWH